MKEKNTPIESKRTSEKELLLPGTKYWWNSSRRLYVNDNMIANEIESLFFPLTKDIKRKNVKRKNIIIW